MSVDSLDFCVVELFTYEDIIYVLTILQEHGYKWPGNYLPLDGETLFKNGRVDEYLCDEEGVEHNYHALMSYLHRDGKIYIHIVPNKRIYYNSEIIYEILDYSSVNVNDLEDFRIIDIFEFARYFGIDLLGKENTKLILNNDISILL